VASPVFRLDLRSGESEAPRPRVSYVEATIVPTIIVQEPLRMIDVAKSNAGELCALHI